MRSECFKMHSPHSLNYRKLSRANCIDTPLVQNGCVQLSRQRSSILWTWVREKVHRCIQNASRVAFGRVTVGNSVAGVTGHVYYELVAMHRLCRFPGCEPRFACKCWESMHFRASQRARKIASPQIMETKLFLVFQTDFLTDEC